MSIFPSLQSGKDSAQYRDSVSFGSRLWRTLELPLYKWVETGVSQSWFYWSHLHPSCRELSMLCHLPCTCNKVGGESTGTEEQTQFSGRADTKSTAGLEERKPEAGTLPALPPSHYVPQVHRPAGAVTPARAPGPMPIFLRCNERKEQGSLWQPRGRQVYTGRGEGSSCYCVSLGTSFIYNTAPLLTSCTHTRSHHQALIFPCLHCWNLFLPLGLSETHWKHTSWRNLFCLPSDLLFLTSFHQLLFSPHLPFPLKLRALPSSYMSLSLPPSLSADSQVSSCYHLPHKCTITIIPCSCSNPSPELIVP